MLGQHRDSLHAILGTQLSRAAGGQPVLGNVRQEISLRLRTIKASPRDAFFGKHLTMLTAELSQAAATGAKPDNGEESNSSEKPWQ